MSVSATFNKSKTNQLILFILERYGMEEEYDEIIQQALVQELIKTSKPRETNGDAPATSSGKKTEKGQSRWTSFQKWAKKWSAWNDTPLDRNTMKEIYASYGEEQLKEWERVASELNAGKDIREIENKPEIKIPSKEPVQEQTSAPSSQETVQDDFEAADINKDGVLSKEEFKAHQAKKEDEELSEVEKLKAALAAAEAKIPQ